MSKKSDQDEKDIQKVINSLKITKPWLATREHAIKVLEGMESVAHMIVHTAVEIENKEKAQLLDRGKKAQKKIV